MTHEQSAATAAPTSFSLRAVRVAAVLAAFSILWQGYSASNVIIDGGAALGPHEIGAVVAHVTTGLLALATAVRWWATREAVWPAAVSTVVFIATFVEASLGHERTLWVHVPLAMLITMGTSAVLVRVFLHVSRHR